MIVTGNFETARPNREAVTILTGDVFGRTNVIAGMGNGNNGNTKSRGDTGNEVGIGPNGDPNSGPHAYLVEQLPGVSLPPHFHLTGQFQVIVAGSGMLGRSHTLEPFTVHYARAKTGYGPIVANNDGLAYLTLRPRIEYGAHYLSDPKTQLDRVAPKFQATGEAVPPLPEGQLAHNEPCEPMAVIQLMADGLGAWLSRGPAGSALKIPAAVSCARRFYVVTRGSALLKDEILPPWSCVWITGTDLSAPVRAGPDGAEVLTLQFAQTGDAAAAIDAADVAVH